LDTARSSHNRINSQEQKGLVLAAEDYSAPEKCQRYFKRDLLDLGYIPIYLAISNRSEYEFTIRREEIIFQFEDGMEAQAVPVQEVINAAYFSPAPALLAMPFGVIPGIALWLQIDHANQKLDQDYSEKIFKDIHIQQHDKMFGFIFFKVPVGRKATSKLMKDASIEVLVSKKAVGNEMAEIFNFILSIEEK